MKKLYNIKKKIIIISCLILLLLSGICGVANIFIQNGNSDQRRVAEYMVEIRVENKTEEQFENLKFGIVDANDTVLEDIDFEDDDENIASFWVGYTNTTEFYLKIKTSESSVKKTFHIKEKDQVDIPQQFLLILMKENGILKIQESS